MLSLTGAALGILFAQWGTRLLVNFLSTSGNPVFLDLTIDARVLGFTAGVALLLAMANLFYRDVKYLFEVVITMWMFGTSVVYPVDRVGGVLGVVLMLNPMTPIVDAYRAVLIRGEMPAAGPFAAAAVLSIVVLAVAWVLFHRAEFQFAENV